MDVFTLNFIKAYCRIAIQENLVRLEECADRNVTKFSKGKCKVLRLGRKNDAAAQQAGPWLPGMQLCGKGCGVLLLNEQGMSLQCALAARKGTSIPGCTDRIGASSLT